MEICRLCLTAQNHQMNIFDESASNINIADVINEHIGEISESDDLPKTVCFDCWNTTEAFHRFYRSVKSAQADYLQRLVKSEVADEVDASEPYGDEFADFKPTNFLEVIQCGKDFDDYFNEDTDTTHGALDDLQEISSNRTSIAKVMLKQINTDLNLSENESVSFGSANVRNSDSIEANEIISQNFDFKCDVCRADLKTFNRAIIHYKKEHNITDGYIKCCGLKFKRQKLVDDHIEWHLNPEIFKCKYCDRIMRTRLSLSTHLPTHRKPKFFICDFCGKSFWRKERLRQHMMGTHVNSFECNICEKRCSTKEQLEAHERLDHNPDIADAVSVKLGALREAIEQTLKTANTEELIFKHFDMTCDLCGGNLKSLQQAQFHYMHEHQFPNGYLKCCETKFEKNLFINEHLAWHLNSEIFKCNICGIMKKSLKNLKAHLLEHVARQGPKQHFCSVCNRAYFAKNPLTRHMKDVHGIAPAASKFSVQSTTSEVTNTDALLNELSVSKYFDMTCDVCNVLLTSLQHAKLHYMEDHGINNGYIKCCNIKFTELKTIDEHLQFHINPDIFKCHICDKTFPRRDRLMLHLYEHKALELKRHTCGVCNNAFISKSRLKKHLRTHEGSKKRTIPCGFCNRLFATEKLQKTHEQRIHHKSEQTKNEICEFCAKSFANQKTLVCHIRLKHSSNAGERVQCKVCDASLSQSTIRAHMLRHSSEPQKCPQCDKVSPNQSALAMHIREVHTERIHKCHLCEKSFKAAYALKGHIGTHTGEKPFRCNYCPRAFIWKTEKYKHQKRVHPDEWNHDRQLKEALVKS